MANRTPGLQPRNQYHRNWGNWTTWTSLSVGDLPNQTLNVLSGPEYTKLEAGDLAYVTTTNPGVYYCVSPGTDGGGDAQWAQLQAGASTVQTIRDAHQLVVAQDGGGFVVSTPTSPANSVGISCDYLDAGDGLQLEAALAASSTLVTAFGTGCDVRVRPCNIVLDVANLAAVPLVIPANVRLIGAGGRHGQASLITGGDGTGATSQRMFALSGNSSLENFHLISPPAAIIPAAEPGEGVVSAFQNALVRGCFIEVQGNGAANRSFGHAIAAGPLTANLVDGFEVDDCRFALANTTVTDAISSYAVFLGDGTLTGSNTAQHAKMHNSYVSGGNGTIACINHPGPHVRQVVHDNVQNAGIGAITHANTTVLATTYEGMQVSDYTVSHGTADDSASISVFISSAAQNNGAIVRSQLSNVRARFADVPNHINDRGGVSVGASVDGAQVIDIQMVNVTIEAADPNGASLDWGVQFDPTSAPGALISDVAMTNMRIVGATDAGAPAVGVGVWIRGDDPNIGGAIEDVGLVNSRVQDCSVANVQIDGPAPPTIGTALDIVIVANHLKGSAIAINDLGGVGTEAAHNIVA